MRRLGDRQTGLFAGALVAASRRVVFSVRSCATRRATAGTFGQGHGAAAERPVAIAASTLSGCSGRRRAARANGLGAGGDERYFCCVCVVAGACGRVWALTWLRQVGWPLRASGDGLGWCWRALGPSTWCVPCAPPRPAVRPFLTRFACLRCCCVGCRCAAATTTSAAVLGAYGLALTSAVTSFSVFAVSGGRDFWLVGAVRLAGVSCPARTDRLTGLRGVCLLAAGRAVKRLAIGCGWAARSAVVVA